MGGRPRPSADRRCRQRNLLGSAAAATDLQRIASGAEKFTREMRLT